MPEYRDKLPWTTPWLDDLPELIAEIRTPDVLRAVVLRLQNDLNQNSPELAIRIREAVRKRLEELGVSPSECEAHFFAEVVWKNPSQYGLIILSPRATK